MYNPDASQNPCPRGNTLSIVPITSTGSPNIMQSGESNFVVENSSDDNGLSRLGKGILESQPPGQLGGTFVGSSPHEQPQLSSNLVPKPAKQQYHPKFDTYDTDKVHQLAMDGGKEVSVDGKPDDDSLPPTEKTELEEALVSPNHGFDIMFVLEQLHHALDLGFKTAISVKHHMKPVVYDVRGPRPGLPTYPTPFLGPSKPDRPRH
ncbi:hypothetical protein BKA61DRAFT_668498 [Leptodontidium sp. MPI-SDFR-AT-0119]|nr:hypothetical protein BKA61DRAFT_668498 [Leptodontidium sp. MPI-SDFR-AT-0119]